MKNVYQPNVKKFWLSTNEDGSYSVGSGDVVLATVHDENIARLFVVSPDLLEVLKKLASYSFTGINGLPDFGPEIRAAIAKVEG
jgi:hypothetical protein